MAFTTGSQQGNSNGTTPVTILSAPSSGTKRILTNGSIYNADTAAATVTIQYDSNGTDYVYTKVTLAAGDTLVLDQDDHIVLPSTTTKLEIVLGGAVTTNELDFIMNYGDES